jgi:hypothetical protein
MNEPEYGTPEWHQHILDKLHNETGVQIHYDQMDFPGGHTFPVLLPKILNSSFTKFDKKNNSLIAFGTVASEHIFPRHIMATSETVSNKHYHSLDFYHFADENENNDVHYSTRYPNPNLLHPEQFGLEVQKHLRTVQDPHPNKDERKYLIENHKNQIGKHLSRNKKILFSNLKPTDDKWKSTLYNPHTGEVQHLNDDEAHDY